MKKTIAIGSAAVLLALCSSAMAQEARWDGFSLGMTGGYAEATGDILGTDNESFGFPDFYDITAKADVELDGFVIGGEIGRDWQKGNLVMGLFGDFTYSNIEDTRYSRYGYADDDNTACGDGLCRANDDDQFTVTNPLVANIGVRAGYDFGPLMLFAGTGLSYGKLEIAVADKNIDSNGNPQNNSTGQGSDDKWVLGFKVKAGAELPVSDKVSVGLSYEYLFLDTDTYKLAGPSYGSTNYDDANYYVELDAYQSSRFLVSLKYAF